MLRKLIKFSNYSYCITLPKQAVAELGWKKGETLEVDFDASGKKMTVTRPKGKVSKPAKGTATSAKKGKTDIKPISKLKW